MDSSPRFTLTLNDEPLDLYEEEIGSGSVTPAAEGQKQPATETDRLSLLAFTADMTYLQTTQAELAHDLEDYFKPLIQVADAAAGRRESIGNFWRRLSAEEQERFDRFADLIQRVKSRLSKTDARRVASFEFTQAEFEPVIESLPVIAQIERLRTQVHEASKSRPKRTVFDSWLEDEPFDKDDAISRAKETTAALRSRENSAIRWDEEKRKDREDRRRQFDGQLARSASNLEYTERDRLNCWEGE